MSLFLFLAAGHFIGDFPFQSQWMVDNKGESWEINAYHALVYTATVFVASAIGSFALSIPALALLLVSHFFLDALKARWGIIKYIWLDQLLHLLVIAVIALFLV